LGVFLDVEGAFDNTTFQSMDDAASGSIGLVEKNTCEIWLSEAEAWLPSDGSLFEGRVGCRVFFSIKLDFKQFSVLERSPVSFRLRFTPFRLVPTTV
jgi:hypothetical protein